MRAVGFVYDERDAVRVAHAGQGRDVRAGPEVRWGHYQHRPDPAAGVFRGLKGPGHGGGRHAVGQPQTGVHLGLNPLGSRSR